jgi:hypothetical protein
LWQKLICLLAQIKPISPLRNRCNFYALRHWTFAILLKKCALGAQTHRASELPLDRGHLCRSEMLHGLSQRTKTKPVQKAQIVIGS